MPSKIILDGNVVEDSWTVVAAESETAALPAGNIIVPLSLWQQQAADLKQREKVGVWLNSDESPALIAADLDSLALVAINFPAFADGRGFSYARELRDTHAYKGEVRAIGAFMRDQLYFLQRCGFNAFALESTELEEALESLSDFSENYQAAIDQPAPLFRRR